VPEDKTLMLGDAAKQGELAAEEIFPLVYQELRRLASVRMARELPGQTLQPTALVHEAWLQLSGSGERSWQSRAHFFGAAAIAMRRILIDRSRRKATLKRGSSQACLELDEESVPQAPQDDTVLLVDEALQILEKEDPEQARVVVLKFFGGLTNQEVAETMGSSERTVERQWACARTRLFDWICEERGKH
jgi:RNA polymerase sigma factor (TIGR02999 family)